MTAKPVQTYDFPCGGILDAYMTEGGRFVLASEAAASEQAALSRVREMLEAKAKEWRLRISPATHADAAELLCAHELESLASTLGDQPASGLEARCERLEAALRDAIGWIKHAPDDAWGMGTNGDGTEQWPIRDELAHKLSAALSDDAGKAHIEGDATP